MTFHVIDWLILLIPVVVVGWVAVKTQRHVKSVADFLVASRAGGRYLVANATSEIAMGAITVVAAFQMYYQSGFVMGWYKQLTMLMPLILVLMGFVVYRYRESRIMTPAEFFERRYSKNFRILMGIMAWVSGTLNFALFPIVGTRFFMYYMGFPTHLQVMGYSVLTEAVLMFILLGCSLTFALAGGQLTVMIADCLEGIISNIMYLVVAAVLVYMFPWSQISHAMMERAAGQSLLDPFHAQKVKDFNLWYVLIGIYTGFYTWQCWQGGHAFKASASSPHETKMAGVLGQWRGYARTVMLVLLAVCAYAYMNMPSEHPGVQWVNQQMTQIAAQHDSQTADQMRIPLALSHFLPIGVKGMFASVMLFAMFSCDSSYLHSFGTIFAQDVILPFRKTHMSPKRHLLLIRLSIVLVAVIAYLYGLLFHQTQYLLMYQMITAAVFLAGAGAANLGGFYWRRATTAGAYAGMITGSTLAFGQMIGSHYVPHFPINGAWGYFIACLAALFVYVVVSLLTCREPFDLDRVLHRGKWAFDENGDPLPPVAKPPRSWKAILGFTPEFTRGDKWISGSLFAWILLMFLVFVVITTWNLLFQPWPETWWASYWYIVQIIVPFVIGAVTCVWFTIGGIRDIRQFFRTLATVRRNEYDDGTVGKAPAAAGVDVVAKPPAPAVEEDLVADAPSRDAS